MTARYFFLNNLYTAKETATINTIGYIKSINVHQLNSDFELLDHFSLFFDLIVHTYYHVYKKWKW